MNRILVIGCPGSGKSVLSYKVASVTGLPLIHLDSLYHDDRWPDDAKLKTEQWKMLVQSLVEGKQWIIDGNYKGTYDLRMRAADTIIFLDYPRWLTLHRMLKRRIEYHKKQRPDMPATWREKISWDFLLFIWSYRSRERPRVLSLLTQYSSGRTIVIARSPLEVERWLSGIPPSGLRAVLSLRTFPE